MPIEFLVGPGVGPPDLVVHRGPHVLAPVVGAVVPRGRAVGLLVARLMGPADEGRDAAAALGLEVAVVVFQVAARAGRDVPRLGRVRRIQTGGARQLGEPVERRVQVFRLGGDGSTSSAEVGHRVAAVGVAVTVRHIWCLVAAPADGSLGLLAERAVAITVTINTHGSKDRRCSAFITFADQIVSATWPKGAIVSFVT
ncbi:hypothetical protein PG985_011659 [Apiospora marii]|uniref:Uncharacterized protein n=1 Tax=Apiospora marii TaxID=335849 RepID=A0ABR1R1C9_9PEZI